MKGCLLPPRNYRTPRPKRKQTERYSTSRESWVQFGFNEFVLYEYDVGDEDDPDPAEALDLLRYKLYMGVGARTVSLRLTNMTAQELDLMQEFLNRAIDKARPICAELDTRAQHAYEEEGNDAFARLYRRVPVLQVRSREQREQSARLARRPKPPKSADAESKDDRSIGEVTPSRIEDESSITQDDPTSSGNIPGVSPVERTEEPAGRSASTETSSSAAAPDPRGDGSGDTDGEEGA